MAAKNTSNSKIKGDVKNIKIKDSPEEPAVALSRASKKSALIEDQDALHYEKGLQLSDEHLNKVKYEPDVLNEVDSILGNKSSATSVKIQRTTITAAIAPANTTVKKEIIASKEEIEESLSNVIAYTPTLIKPARVMDIQASEVNLNSTTGESQASSDENKKECNNVIRLAPKALSDEERRKLRAKRFNIIVADSCQIAERNIKPVSTPVCKNTFSTANNPTPTYGILKKRAERFGENVSTVMKSLDFKEKMLKRKLKFLESVTNLKELEIKKRRAERFRMV